MGRKPTEPLVDTRDLIEEEVAMCNYPLKSRKETVQQENEMHYQNKEV